VTTGYVGDEEDVVDAVGNVQRGDELAQRLAWVAKTRSHGVGPDPETSASTTAATAHLVHS